MAEEIAAVRSQKPEILGEDPISREFLFHKVAKADQWGGHLPITAYGPIDVALWDIAAKKAGLPLYQFIGGYCDRIMAYLTGPRYSCPKDYVREAVLAREPNFKAYKLHPPGDAKLDIECCHAVREEMGKEFILMSDHEGALWVG